MNRFEHFWDELERRVREHQPQNEKELRDTLQAEWSNIGSDATKKLVQSVTNHLYECARLKAYPTTYSIANFGSFLATNCCYFSSVAQFWNDKKLKVLTLSFIKTKLLDIFT